MSAQCETRRRGRRCQLKADHPGFDHLIPAESAFHFRRSDLALTALDLVDWVAVRLFRARA